MSKISKLRKELEKLKGEELKARKNIENHRRRLNKAIEEDTYKKAQKHEFKLKHYRSKLEKIRIDIGVMTDGIAILEEEEARELYRKKLSTFDKEMVSRLGALKSGLDIFISELFVCDLGALMEEVRSYYSKYSSGFSRGDLRPYANLDFLGMKVRIANILEKVGRARVLQATQGDIIYRGIVKGKPILWAKQLSNQLKDTIKVLRARSGLETLEEKIASNKK